MEFRFFCKSKLLKNGVGPHYFNHILSLVIFTRRKELMIRIQDTPIPAQLFGASALMRNLFFEDQRNKSFSEGRLQKCHTKIRYGRRKTFHVVPFINSYRVQNIWYK